jgi:Protein of unknown function (DUF1549)/Protein of unknown function (DUF1553)/Planctomycete cytochrome C
VFRAPLFPRLIAKAAVLAVWVGSAQPVRLCADEADHEFFEKHVRPILVARCYECHSGQAKTLKGGLRLDSRAAALKGGDTGPAIVPARPKDSLLIDAINYGELYQMPPKSRLPAEEVAALTKWVQMGAHWPPDAATSPSGYETEFDLARRKAAHWCWQPIKPPPVPMLGAHSSALRAPIDSFIPAGLESRGLSPAPPADERTLIRRAYFDLIGLPPTADEVEAFIADSFRNPQSAFCDLIDRLLASPHFGERWARHWLDLVRYAESRGHEFDYDIPNAYEYRDYVIRALNADLPYNQFVMEHVAGDLFPKPRLNPEEKLNESIIATGFWFLGEWCHSPVDIRKDECDRIDNMLDVFSKTFLGVTVACARCHDHKFDAISQRDYYALAGYLQSASYRLTRFETWQQDRQIAAKLAALDAKYLPQIARVAADALQPRVDELAERLVKEGETLKNELGVPETELHGAEVIVDYADPPSGAWMTDGPTFGQAPVRPGQLVVTSDPAAPLEVTTYGAARRSWAWGDLGIAKRSENDSGRLAGWLRAGRTLKTPTFTLSSGYVHYLIEGVGQVYAAVDSHAMNNGPLHTELIKDTGGNSDLPTRWITHDLSRYVGHRAHLEFCPKEDEEFRILQVVEGRQRPAAPVNRPNRLVEKALASAERSANVAACQQLIRSTLDLLAANRLGTDPEPQDRAALASWLVAELKPDGNGPRELPDLIATYTSEQEKVSQKIGRESRLCMAMWEGTPVDESVLIRGNHKSVGPSVSRRLLEALDDRPIKDRLQLAQRLVDPTNPLVSRVIVNRVWQHLMGRGIVPSVDNFGVLGERPTHPDLLDYLADEFMRDGWSVKRLIRRIMLSSTYRQASRVGSQES